MERGAASRQTVIGLLAWLGLAAVVAPANAEGPVVKVTKHSLTIFQEAAGKVVTYKLSEEQKKGVHHKRREWAYPHLAKQVGVGDTVWVEYERRGKEIVLTHIRIKTKANGGPVPPRPAEWDKELEIPPQAWRYFKGKKRELPKKN